LFCYVCLLPRDDGDDAEGCPNGCESFCSRACDCVPEPGGGGGGGGGGGDVDDDYD
jgi:hypothetical protein